MKMGMMTRGMALAAGIVLHTTLFTPTATAQTKGMVTDFKVLALQEFSEVGPNSAGYYGADSEDLDFRKGRGGGYVFVVFKKSDNPADTVNYITDVVVTAKRENMYGQNYTDGDNQYIRANYFQVKKHEDKTWYGGLNGRNYSIYGGAYSGQDHIYLCHTGSLDFNKRVLKDVKVLTSKQVYLEPNQTQSGPHAGGGRCFLFTWHTHKSQFKPVDTNCHRHYCGSEDCGLDRLENHRFDQRYGNDIWGQYPSSNDSCGTHHYKICIDCGRKIPQEHHFATYVSNWDSHTKRCLVCGYVDNADHAGFGRQKIPVDEKYHIIYCDSCQFMKRLEHDFSLNRYVKHEDCDKTLVEYTCSQCYHHAIFEEKGLGHEFDANGICRRPNCLHPYEQPTVERSGGDSTFVVKNYGHLYWVADYVNNRRPKTNIRLANDLVADTLITPRWHPIAAADSIAFQGTFDGDGHVISMLQTEEPVAGSDLRGLFGVIGKGGTVKNVVVAACDMRGWDYIGAVAGVNEGTIDGCHVVFSMISSIGSGKNLGGICGLNKGTISSCTTEKTVWVGGVLDYAGGICGTNEGGTLSGNVTAAICGSGSDAVLPEAASKQ